MLKDTLMVIINNPFIKENLQEKKKKINILTAFYISYKSNVKTFLK